MALSVILIVIGLLPHERVSDSRELKDRCLVCSSSIEAYKGDIMEVNYEIEGSHVAFYLTYNEIWRGGDQDYIIKKEPSTHGHFKIDVEKSGLYYLNFESSNPSSSDPFDVNLDYKIMNRYSPVHIVIGVVLLVIGFILAIFCPKEKERLPLSIEEKETVLG